MENLIFILIIVLAAAEVFLIALVLDTKNLASVTSLTLAIGALILSIRMYYFQRRLDQLQTEEISEDFKNLIQDQ